MFLETSKSPIFPEMFHIRQIKSTSCEASECRLHFDIKLVVIG